MALDAVDIPWRNEEMFCTVLATKKVHSSGKSQTVKQYDRETG